MNRLLFTAALLAAFSNIAAAHATDHEKASFLIVKKMREKRVSWLDILGPLDDPFYVDLRAGTLISGAVLDAFTIPRLALMHLAHLPPLWLAQFAYWRHGE